MSELCLKAKEKAGLTTALPLLVTHIQTSPLADLPKPLLLPNLETRGFLCVQSIVSNCGLSASHLNPPVDSVAACSSAAGQHHPGQHSAAACSGEIRQIPT